MITQKELKELLNYNPDTGAFTWRVTRGKATKGKLAGCVCLKNTKKYLVIGLNNRIDRAHRLAFLYMTGEWPSQVVDHINGDGLDNRWCNLREVSIAENCKNMRLHSHNSSGVSGVSWRQNRQKWRAYITIGNKQKTLGHYEDFFDAICARKSEEIKQEFHSNHGSVRPL